MECRMIVISNLMIESSRDPIGLIKHILEENYINFDSPVCLTWIDAEEGQMLRVEQELEDA